MDTKSSKLYISGATGFVGTHLIKDLEESSLTIVKIGRKELSNLENFQFEESSDFIHLAAHVHNMVVTDKEAEKLAHENINHKLSVDLYKKFISESKSGTFIFTSTVHVHANLTNGVFKIKDTPKPISPYGISKLAAENDMLKLISNKPNDCRLVIVRLPMVYGPGNKGNILRLISTARKKIRLPIGDFNNARSLVYVKNVTFSILKILQNSSIANGSIYFITDEEDKSLSQMYDQIYIELNQRKGSFYFPKFIIRAGFILFDILEKLLKRPLPLNSEAYHRLNNEYRFEGNRLLEEMNVHLPYDFKSGIRETIDYYQRGQN